MAATARDLLVLAEPGVKPEASRFARRLGAPVEPVDISRVARTGRAKRFLVYLRGNEPPGEVKSFLRRATRGGYKAIVLYSAERAPQTAAKWGMVLGETRPKRTHLCFEPGEVADLLQLVPEAEAPLESAAIRKRLGLTQEQLAGALKLSTRTIQNWEAGIGLGQMKKRARDVLELIELLDDYIPKEQQARWLRSPNDALGGRAPIDLVLDGRIRDVIVEFRRLQEGQPA